MAGALNEENSQPNPQARTPIPNIERTIEMIRNTNINEILRKYNEMYETVEKISGFEEFIKITRRQTEKELRIFNDHKEDIIRDLIELPKRRIKIGYEIKSEIGGIILIPQKNFVDVSIKIYKRPERFEIPVLSEEERNDAEAFLTGLWLADGFYHAKLMEMETHSFSQIILFAALLGSGHVSVNGISFTMEEPKLIYYVYKYDKKLHKLCGQIKSHQCKTKVIQQLERIDEVNFYRLLYGHIVGDGTTYKISGTRYIRIKDPSHVELISWFRQRLSRYSIIKEDSVNDNENKTHIIITGPRATTLVEKILSYMPTRLLELMKRLPDDIGFKAIFDIPKYKYGKITIASLGTVIFDKNSIRIIRLVPDEKVEKIIEEIRKSLPISLPLDAISIHKYKYMKSTRITIKKKYAMQIICCDPKMINKLVEAARHSSNQNAKEWDDVEKVRQKCWRYFQMHGLKCEESPTKGAWVLGISWTTQR